MVKARRNFPHATNWRALHGITNFRHTQIFVYECAKLSPIVEGKQLEGNIRLPLLILTPVWPFKKHATGEKCVGVKTVWDQHWSDIIELVVPKCYPDSLNTSKNHSLMSMLCCPLLVDLIPMFHVWKTYFKEKTKMFEQRTYLGSVDCLCPEMFMRTRRKSFAPVAAVTPVAFVGCACGFQWSLGSEATYPPKGNI